MASLTRRASDRSNLGTSTASARLRSILVAACAALTLLGACTGSRAAMAAADQAPPPATDAVALLRRAAAQRAAGDCDAAITTARAAMLERPQDALGPLVIGECLESRGAPDSAIAVYEAFTRAYPGAAGASTVAARTLLAQRAIGVAAARRLLTSEATIATGPADPNVVAVMPLELVGDSSYAALSVGLANLLVSDLALVRRFTIVERARLDALLAELARADSGRVDPATAARAGRLLRAGTIVNGFTLVAPGERVRIDVSAADSSTRILGGESVSGRLADLFKLEKQLAVALIERLGHRLSEAERKTILENGTESLAAFLAYSQGLLEQNSGNYGAAALSFARAVQADPGFRQARNAHRTSEAATRIQATGTATDAGVATMQVGDAATLSTASPGASAITSGVQTVSPTIGESLGGGTRSQQATATASAQAPPATTGILSQAFQFGIRLIFQFP